MKVAFYSNYLNHHQLPFCLEMVKSLGDDFKFIATEKIEKVVADATEEPVGYLLKDVKTAADEAGYADMARTGCFADTAAIIDENIDAKTVKDKLAARCLFFKGVVAVKD